VTFLMLNAWGMGGTIRATHNLAGYLADGYDVELLSAFRKADEPFFPFPAGVKVAALDDKRPASLTGRGRRRGMLARCPSILVHPADASSSACNLRMDLTLIQKLRGRSGFLIGTRPGFNLIAARLRLPGLVSIGQEHLHLGAHNRFLKRDIRRNYRKLDALGVLTDEDSREYRAFLGSGPRIVSIPNAAEIGGAAADLSARTVLAAGRLNPQKGFDLLISAFGRVAREYPEWRLRICGSGGMRGRLNRQIQEEGLSQVIELPGPCNLAEEMARASIFVLSSRKEGFPVVLLEAMSKGMAVVSFDCPTGPRAVLEDHRNGVLVPAEDSDALAVAILELIENDDLRQSCAAAAVETSKAYTMDAIGRQWRALLIELAQAPDRPQPGFETNETGR
jgi:glycosyltransferase involved in cell wall biosynthesis